MIFLRRPTVEYLRQFVAEQHGMSFSYPEVGSSATTPPPGYAVDHNRIQLGAGEATFTIAIQAIKNWKMFATGWTFIYPENAPIETGATVAVCVRIVGTWWLNACRIVYMIHDEDDEIKRYEFAYGTLHEHAETGEECFSVEWNKKDNSVWYDLYAFSRPRHVLACLAYPVSRMMQRRFARDSKRAMVMACNGASISDV